MKAISAIKQLCYTRHSLNHKSRSSLTLSTQTSENGSVA